MDLTTAEGLKFWPLYQEYQDKIVKENDKTLKMMADLLTADDLKDEELVKAADDYAKTEKNKISIRRDYLKKVAKVLPPRKAVR